MDFDTKVLSRAAADVAPTSGSTMARRTTASSAARFALIATALLLPTLSMIPLGGLYLWEKGWLLVWAACAAISVATVYVAQSWLFASPGVAPATDASGPQDSPPNPTWTPVEEKAWADVRRIAVTVDVDSLTDTAALMDVAHKTINAVANRIHADKDDALWRFTMPEALAITERVSGRLNDFIVRNIPFGDRLTVSQALQIYRWRSIAGVAERAYNLWRIVRLGNPATALTHEARERLSRAMMQWGREHVAKRLAETFVEEVGRAAIDLYGGRLALSHSSIHSDSGFADDSNHRLDLSLAPVHIAIVAERSLDRAALLNLLGAMEQQRTAAVTEFVRGDNKEKRFLRLPRLVPHAFVSALSAADLRAAANTDMILFASAHVARGHGDGIPGDSTVDFWARHRYGDRVSSNCRAARAFDRLNTRVTGCAYFGPVAVPRHGRNTRSAGSRKRPIGCQPRGAMAGFRRHGR